jgi:diacylglycerol kinase (ATP)
MRRIKTVFNREAVQFYITERAAHAIILTAEALAGGATEIIAVGGDGTLNEVINGVMKSSTTENELAQQVNVSVYPKGRGNDFAKTVKMPADLEILKYCIDNDKARFIDLGIAYFTNKENHSVSRYFINITDVGMGGIIAEKLSGYSKWLGAFVSFQRAIISTLATYKKQLVLIKTNEREDAGEMMNIVVANGKYFGNGLGIAPEASLDDGNFSLITIGDISLLDYLKLMGQVKKCRLLNHPEVKYTKGKELWLDSPLDRLPIDMDGEFVGYSPMKVRMLSQVIKFRFPGG